MTPKQIVYALCGWAHVNLQEYCRENRWPYEGVKENPELVGIICSRIGKPTPENLQKLQTLVESRDELGNPREHSTSPRSATMASVEAS